MRFFTSTVVVLAACAAVAAADKPPKWEYAELVYRPNLDWARPLKDEKGKEFPADPVLQWTTGSGNITAKSWTELAEKLKAPVKKDAEWSLKKVHVLNAIGADGWELVRQEGSTVTSGQTAAWTFKRRVPDSPWGDKPPLKVEPKKLVGSWLSNDFAGMTVTFADDGTATIHTKRDRQEEKKTVEKYTIEGGWITLGADSSDARRLAVLTLTDTTLVLKGDTGSQETFERIKGN